MRYTVVLPYIVQHYMQECMATCKLDNVLLIDNTKDNFGIMKSHNIGIDKMREDNSDWLIVLSAAIRFGKPGGLDFIEQIEKNKDHLALEAAGVFGWHLIAFSRELIEKVGRWDENFTPYGFDDLDFSWRIQLAYEMEMGRQLWIKVPVDLTDMGMAHSVHLGKVRTVTNDLIDYYRSKWGVHPGDDHTKAFKTPYNDHTYSVDYWHKAKNGGRHNGRYSMEIV